MEKEYETMYDNKSDANIEYINELYKDLIVD